MKEVWIYKRKLCSNVLMQVSGTDSFLSAILKKLVLTCVYICSWDRGGERCLSACVWGLPLVVRQDLDISLSSQYQYVFLPLGLVNFPYTEAFMLLLGEHKSDC
jgi:hypothetical protein